MNKQQNQVFRVSCGMHFKMFWIFIKNYTEVPLSDFKTPTNTNIVQRSHIPGTTFPELTYMAPSCPDQ